MKTGSEFCCDEHLEQHKAESVHRLLEYQQAKPTHSDEDPIHRLGLIGAGPPVVEEQRRVMELQPFVLMDVRRFNPERTTNLCLFQDQSAISPRPLLPLRLQALTLWDPSRVAPVVSRRAPDPLASLLKALPKTTAGPLAVNLHLLDPGLPPLATRSQRGSQGLAGNGRVVRQPSLAHPGGVTACRNSGYAQPVEHLAPLAVQMALGAASVEVAGSHLQICSVAPAVCLPPRGALDQTALVPMRGRAASFRELASRLCEPESQPWRPPHLEAWPDRPARPAPVPAGPPPRNLTRLVQPRRVARALVFVTVPPVPGAEATAPALLLSPGIRDRVQTRPTASAEARPPSRHLESSAHELSPVGLRQTPDLSQEPAFAPFRPLTLSLAPDRPLEPMPADQAGVWPSPIDPRQAGVPPCEARPPEVGVQTLRPPGFAAIRRGPAAPAGQFVELNPERDQACARQVPEPVPVWLRAPARLQQVLPGPEPQKVTLAARRPVRPSPEPLPVVEEDVDHLGAAVEEAPVEDHLRLTLEQSQRARGGLLNRLPREATLAWHETVLPALASRRVKAGLAAAVVLVLLLVSLHNPRSFISAALGRMARPIQERSYFLLEEDFQQGASAWTNPGILSRRADGLVEVQDGLSLYRPSLTRDDYEFRFSGLVRKGGLDWVVRAADAANYCAFKLTRQGTGRDRRSVLLRYAVISGSPADKPHVSTLPFDLEDNKMYEVTVQVSGERISTLISDRGVDSYSDSRLLRGGVGFFAEPGEGGLVHSLSLAGNDDPTGRTIFWLRDFYRFCTRQPRATRAGD